LSGISLETQTKIKLWNPHDRATWPEWYRWDGGWYENDCENTRYTVWDGLGDNAIVFDVGGYEGEWTSRMIAKYPGYRYYAFEPAPRAFEVMRKRLSELENVNLYNFGLGVTSGKFRLYDAQRDAATFVPIGGVGIDAEIRNIGDFMESESVECVDLMSVNIEGGEFELLPYLIGSRLIQKVRRFMIQWHSVVVDARRTQVAIQDALARTHEMLWNHGAWEAWILQSRE
jgi:FkbM family methyltransferase